MKRHPFELPNSRGWPIRGEVRWDSREAGPDPGRPLRAGAGGPRLLFICHGFKGFKDWGFFPWLAESLAADGHIVVTFNFSGSGIGENPLEFTERDRFHDNSLSLEIEDLERVFAAAFEQRLPMPPGAPVGRPAVLGHSRGAVAAFVLASRHPEIGRLVAWAGVGLLGERYPPEVRKEWRERGLLEVVNSRTGQVLSIGVSALDDLEAHARDYDPRRIAADIDIPCLLVHGSADETVPMAEAAAIVERSARPGVRLRSIDGGGHTFGAVHPFRGPTPHLEQALDATRVFLAEGE
jgi:pimeloyl-ACP methyl ester carboxylesterase